MIDGRILFLSSNGVGLGHLSRQLAIATRLDAGIVPVIHTQAYGVSLVRQFGIPGLWHQHHSRHGMDVDAWNKALGFELIALEKRLEPSAIVIDSTVVFSCYCDALQKSAARKVWIRRGFWPERHQRFLQSAHLFDTIIEPGDLAEVLDEGPTAGQRDQVTVVPPVLLVNPYQRQPAAIAKRILGIPEDKLVVALQLGNSFGDRTEGIRQKLINALAEFPVQIVDLRSPLEGERVSGVGSGSVKQVSVYPSFTMSRAFDACVTVPGYNSFHECILGGIPALFLPNTSPDMDRQDLRARWSVERGLALLADPDLPVEVVREQISKLLSPDFARQVEERSANLTWSNGALDIASLLSGISRDAYTLADNTG
ncbi:putative glycosyl transferase [Roseibium album]|nr:putative glycosyl transferase [Roseibium album]